MPTELIVVGVSAGGMNALRTILPPLPGGFTIPIAVVQHQKPSADDFLCRLLDEECSLSVKHAEDKEEPNPGAVYLAPPDYHLLIEEDKSFSLSVDPRVNHARPAIDVLFESAAEVHGENLTGVVLTGASSDGSRGLQRIKERGGTVIVQDPATAEYDVMPRSAIAAAEVDRVLPLLRIGSSLMEIQRGNDGRLA